MRVGELWRAWNRWRGLAWRERGLALEAALLLPLVALGLQTAGFRRVHRWLGGDKFEGLNVRTFERSNAGTLSAARSVARFVDGVARRHPCRPTCLTRSLTLLWLLRRRGIAGDLRVGVRKEGGSLQAHAWVEHLGYVLGEAGDVGGRFAALGRAKVQG